MADPSNQQLSKARDASTEPPSSISKLVPVPGNDIQKPQPDQANDQPFGDGRDAWTTPGPRALGDAFISNGSPPSTGIQLLDLPVEILGLIIAEVINVSPISLGWFGYSILPRTIKPSFALAPHENVVDGDRFMPWYTNLEQGSGGLPANGLAVLRACNKLYELGLRALYGMHEFTTYSAEAFRCLFTKHIGPTKLGFIQKLTLGLPHAVKTKPSMYLGRYMRMVENMTGLQKLTVTTTTRGLPRTHVPCSHWVEVNRGLLHLASWTTLRSPRLKYAVWEESGTVLNNRIEQRWSDGRLSVVIGTKRPRNLRQMANPLAAMERNSRLWDERAALRETLHANYLAIWNYEEQMVDYLACQVHLELLSITPFVIVEDEWDDYDDMIEEMQLPSLPIYPQLLQITAAELDIFHREPETIESPSGLLLNSWKIRRVGFEKLGQEEHCRPYEYQLPPSASGSESVTPALETMSGNVLAEELYLHNKNEFSNMANVPETFSVERLFDLAGNKQQRNVKTELYNKDGPPIVPYVEEEQLEEEDFYLTDMFELVWPFTEAADPAGAPDLADDQPSRPALSTRHEVEEQASTARLPDVTINDLHPRFRLWVTPDNAKQDAIRSNNHRQQAFPELHEYDSDWESQASDEWDEDREFNTRQPQFDPFQ
ncbi:uncharacterized protein HMPREF1541_01297 [Cyphellophora europaea CBS 101466]|uniref:Uncharacterized protein n=1 Tax=Cyphellophora europaea (strain CBS 101466) TaxID=1220924 RepID=W2SEI8_CYPE1|nr:uncharacterized protein HMPREF1541_01297 [Cyphellophora europaea CBS 101466]ETN47107.1 hypothetical protein HMPREF1541_01297 [Cyphellophora europaea CBS 101466]